MGPRRLWLTNVLNSALPPQWLSPDTLSEHQDPVSHMAASVGGSPAEAGLAVAHCGDKDTGSKSSGKYSLA